MDSNTSTTSPVQVQGSAVELKAANLVEESLNQSGDSTDSLKENLQPENNRSSQNHSLNESKSQPAETNVRDSLTSAPPPPLQPKSTCNNDFLSSDDESFADCPSSFNSPAVNKLLQVGDSLSSQVRQSLGLDALVNNMGKFTIDQSLCANTTVDIGGADKTMVVPGVPDDEVEEIKDESVDGHSEVEEPPESDPLNSSEPFPPPPPSEDLIYEDDVEMMSVVMESGVDADYSHVALPGDEETFPESPPTASVKVTDEEEQSAVEEASHVAIVNDESFQMDVDVTQNIAEPEILEHSSDLSANRDLEVSQESSVHAAAYSASPLQRSIEEIKPKSAEVQRDFKMPTMLRKSLSNQPQAVVANPFDGQPTGVADFKQELFFSSKDFDFLQSKETANSLSTAIKDSVLLKFDPLINQPVIVESRTVAAAKTSSAAVPPIPSAAAAVGEREKVRLHSLDCSREGGTAASNSSVLEEQLEDEQEEDSLLEVFGVVRSQKAAATSRENNNCGGGLINCSASGGGVGAAAAAATAVESGQVNRDNCPISKLVDVTMSLVDVNNDSNLSVSISGGGNISKDKHSYSVNSSNISSINFEDVEHHQQQNSKLRMSVEGQQQQQQHHNTSNGEVKIRNERYDDMDRKMKEMEEKEELLLKRLSEKEKQIAKMSHIVEEYERSIAGLLKERAISKEEYEKRCMDLETERNANYQHLSSLESTFSDLHLKYERSKQIMENLKKSEENLLADKRQSAEQAALQEQRYEKLKSHAMTQMEIANTRLRDESTQANQEISRLRALLKKEEITRCSLQEQLNQKTREIEELMKIWDELKSDP